MRLSYTVYMNKRDITEWVSSLKVRQPANCLYKEFELELLGWTSVEDNASWDIYGTYDSTTAPRAEPLILNGILPPDRDRYPSIDQGTVPTLKIKGYSRIWLCQRKAPTETLVMVPGTGRVRAVIDGQEIVQASLAQVAIDRYGGPLGRYKVVRHMNSFASAVGYLANQAGFKVDFRLPNYPLEPFVCDPEKSYWELIKDLIEPWAPELWYREPTNTLAIVDPLAPRYQIGRSLGVPSTLIAAVDAVPIRTNRVRRVFARFPRGN